MSSAARSGSVSSRFVRRALRDRAPRVLSGPVTVCIDRPLLALDRPFTYELPEELGAGLGSVVQVPFHGRATRAWVLGETDDVRERMLRVRKLVTAVRSFDEPSLALFRAMSERYVAPLATVIGRAVPPRVASEETSPWTPPPRGRPLPAPGTSRIETYRDGPRLLKALRTGRGAFVVRPAPTDEADVAVTCVAASLAAGRTAISSQVR